MLNTYINTSIVLLPLTIFIITVKYSIFGYLSTTTTTFLVVIHMVVNLVNPGAKTCEQDSF